MAPVYPTAAAALRALVELLADQAVDERLAGERQCPAPNRRRQP
jgi:hypothetical protein